MSGPVVTPSIASRAVATAAGLLVRPQLSVLSMQGAQLRYLRSAAGLGGTFAGWGVPATIEAVADEGFAGEWVRAPEAGAAVDGVVLYLHGGGYVVSSPKAYRCVSGPLSAYASMPVLAVAYRRTPEHLFPAAHDDALAAFDWLVASGVPASRIVLAGDSAGAHLAVGLLVTLAQRRRAMPAAALLFSPVLDPELVEARRRDARDRDPVVPPRFVERCLELGVALADRRDPRAAPLTARPRLFGRFPPVLTQVGSTECFVGDAERLHRLLSDAGVPNRLVVHPGQVHSFITMARLLPEARLALRDAADFARSNVDARRALAG